MTTMNQTFDHDTTDRDELVDFSIRLGQGCWGVYCRSKVGLRQFRKIHNDKRLTGENYCRANELFQLGFSARMLFLPPIGIPALDAITEKPMGDRAWEHYLAMHEGEVVLDGPAYPDTPSVVLDYAKEFFLEGFRAGTLAVREILNS